MIVHAGAEVDVTSEYAEEDEDVVAMSSIFSDLGDPAADKRACFKVWTMFVKASNSGGIDARSRQQRAASANLANQRQAAREAAKAAQDLETESAEPTEDAMANSGDGLTERQRKVLDVYEKLRRELGRVPANPEIAEALNAWPWATEQVVRATRNALVDLGLAEKRPRGGRLHATPADPERATPTLGDALVEDVEIVDVEVVQTKPKRTHRAASATAADSDDDPILTELVARRAGAVVNLEAAKEVLDAWTLKVEQFDTAIAAVRAAT